MAFSAVKPETCVVASRLASWTSRRERGGNELRRQESSTCLTLLSRTGMSSLGGKSGHGRGSHLTVRARINIDRRRHLEEAFKRQLEAEQRRALMAVSCPLECVREVCNLVELEAELEAAEGEGQMVVVDFYNSACGACKNMLPQLITMCKTGALDNCFVDFQQTKPSLGAIPARILKHNVWDEYDDLTDIARLYRIKVVPTFAFFMDGSRISQLVTRDSTRVAELLARLVQERQCTWGSSDL